MYALNITPVANGFVVNAGCLTLIFEDKVKMITEIARWMDNPEAVEKEYQDRYCRRPMPEEGPAQEATSAGYPMKAAMAGLSGMLGSPVRTRL